MSSKATGDGLGPRDAVPPSPRSTPLAPPSNANGPLRRVVRIVNPLGLHLRVADRFSRTAKQFACVVTVWNGDARANGKSIMDLITLVALPGAELVVEVDGDDAPAALDPLAEILAAAGGEDYAI